jgi:hypothetical protein
MKKEDKGMTINEVDHYFQASIYNEKNVIRIQLHDDGFYYWNAETGECVKAKDLNRRCKS